MISRVALIILIRLTLSITAYAETDASIDSDVTVLSSSDKNIKIEATLTSAMMKSTDIFFNSWDGQFPEYFRVVRSLSIKVNGRKIFVPHSAYADLVWLANIKLKISKPLNQIIISGGDASESYSAKIEFDQKSVRSRKLYSNEFPEKPTEYTKYYLHVI